MDYPREFKYVETYYSHCMLTDKYRPQSLSDIVGNNKAIKELQEWGENWSISSSPVILHGPAGVGKTSAVHALANDMNWNINELNASDKRGKHVINKEVESAVATTTIQQYMKQKIILLDEADNIHGHADRGGKRAITKVVDNAKNPIVFTANNLYDMSRSLRNKCKTIKFKRVSEKKIMKYIRRIAQQEDISYTDHDLQSIAENANGDIRAAVNDMERYKYQTTVDKQSQRDQSKDIFSFIDDILQSGQPDNVRKSAKNVDKTPYELYWWIERNLFNEYSSTEIENALPYLSQSAELLNYVNKSQNYMFWKFITDYLTYGIAKSRKRTTDSWTRWQPPSYRTYSINTSLNEKIARNSNMSHQAVSDTVVPFLNQMIEYCKPEDLTAHISAWYNLDKNDISEITGSGKSTQKMERVISKKHEYR